MASTDLIDTTEMYLKTIFEMEEDGVVPLRARIVERLGHSGPTVSQTVSRMERDGLVLVRGDRRLEMQPRGREIAVEVIRKHRLAERLLVDVIGVDWAIAHDEACRWEHVMSEAVEEQLQELLGHPKTDPYGNPIPGNAQKGDGENSLDHAIRASGPHGGTVTRIGEPIQADLQVLEKMNQFGVKPGAKVGFTRENGDFTIWVEGRDEEAAVTMPASLAPHFFISGT